MRIGPMRVGFYGILQPVADALKLISKEDILPSWTDRRVYWIAPIAVFIPSFLLWVTIPISRDLVIRNLDLGLFYIGTAQAKPWVASSRGMTTRQDALYTNSTLALNPRTGTVEWYFQHAPGETLDLELLALLGGELKIIDILRLLNDAIEG